MVATLAGALVACESSTDRVLSIDAEGRVSGFIFLDRNATGVFEQNVDAPAAGIGVSLVLPGGTTPIAQTTTDATGNYVFSNVPVGRYGLRVDPSLFGDSLRVGRVDSATFTVAVADTPRVGVSLTYPITPLASVRTGQLGKRVLVQGVALNAYAAFGDSTLHLADASGVLRAVRVSPIQVVAGDTVRLLGTITLVGGAATISDATAFRVGTGPFTRTPVPLTTALAATANGGQLDADLVKISNATIINTIASTNGRVTATVDDGSGTVQVVIEPTGAFANRPALLTGALLSATGLLVPNDARTAWVLKPRATADLAVGFRRVTIAEARTMEPGRLVEIEGIALNGWLTFADATVHVSDPTGWLRATAVRSTAIFAGDSVRFLGTIVLNNGQPTLTQVEPLVLATGRIIPQPINLTTAQVASANGGAADAALVRTVNATIVDVATVAGGDFQVRINDNSGVAVVIIDRDLGLVTTGLVANARVTVTGLLVPTPGGGSWQLKPRSQSDIVVNP